METLQFFAGGEYRTSKTDQYREVYNPSTGEVTARVPNCTSEEIIEVIEIANEAYKSWSKIPVTRRAKLMFKVHQLLEENLEELTHLVAEENGKSWSESEGDVLKAIEGTEMACAMPTLMMGESLMDTSTGFDTVMYRESVGVFAGITPFNFPAMIPFGWMTPMCIAAGNCIILKVSSKTPRTALRIAAIYKEAGIPDGVVNVVTCTRNEAEIFLSHEGIKGISFVGTTNVGKHIYATGASNGKRVQALCEAKNHALVLKDAPIDRTAAGVMNSAFGCAGERCMALPVVVVEDVVADEFVAKIVELAKARKIGPAYDKSTELGPSVDKGHMESVEKWIQTGIDEGADLVLDGRGVKVEGYENGFYIGPTIFDNVTEDMTIGSDEIFGPVLCIKRVKNFEEGIELMNNNRFANGSVIFTQSGYYAREFYNRTDGGMVGVNVGIPVPVGLFPFTGHKDSFFGDLHVLGKDGVRFFTQSKTITSRWFDEEEAKVTKVDTWDGTI